MLHKKHQKLLPRYFFHLHHLNNHLGRMLFLPQHSPLLLRVEVGLYWVVSYFDCRWHDETMLNFILPEMLDDIDHI